MSSEVGSDTARRRRRFRSGVSAEFWAAVYLTIKGYRVVARRYKTAAGEVDLIAVRRKRVAFVEVKRRRRVEDAQSSVTLKQRRRVRRAADIWLGKNPRYQHHELGFDLLFLISGRLPIHLENAL